MKIADLIPSKDTLDGLQGVEKQLQSRRYAGAWSLLLAGVTVGFQVIKLVLSDAGFRNVSQGLRNAVAWLQHCTRQDIVQLLGSYEAIVFYLAVTLSAVWLITRYTGILFKQSNAPFRYTFSIEDFSRVKDTPEAGRFQVERLDQMNLLRNDLIERLKRRVQRFSLLEIPTKGGSAPVAKDVSAASHFHIKAEYATRQDESGVWIVHVWPRIRIGADGNSFTLAYPVRLPIIDGSNKEETEKKGILDPGEYQRLVERVYSSIATEIYKQIEIDLRDKMTLFPTLSLRALARYVEAEDFETSNTIDAYDRALDMYRTSLEELNASQLHWLKKRFEIRSAMRAEAKTKLGYSRCLIYRRLATEMAGREGNSIFSCKQKLEDAIELLRQTYNTFSFSWFRQQLPRKIEQWSEAKIAMAQDGVRRPLWRKRQYRQVRGELCETLAVAALAYSNMGYSMLADKFLKVAETLVAGDCHDRIQLLMFLAKAELKADLRKKLEYLSQGKDLSLDSEIALYRFAYYSDLLARDEDQITDSRVENLNRKYEDVLRVNPANIASLIGQGYLLWLVDKQDEAASKLNAGIELQKIVKQTFVGDLKYCLARVKLEQFWKQAFYTQAFYTDVGPVYEALFLYEDATAADPSVEACFTDSQDKSKNTYYNFIDKTVLHAYERFANRAKALGVLPGVDPSLANRVLGYALNDQGNALLSYYLRHQVPTTGNPDFSKALDLLRKRQALCPESFSAKYNYFTALTQADSEESPELSEEMIRLAQSLLDRSDLLPAAVLVEVVRQIIGREAATNPTDWLNPDEWAELSEKGRRYDLLDARIKDLEKRLRTMEASQQIEPSDSVVSSLSTKAFHETPKPSSPKSNPKQELDDPAMGQGGEPSRIDFNVAGQTSVNATQFGQNGTGTHEENVDRGGPKADAGDDAGTLIGTAQSESSKALANLRAKLARHKAARDKLGKLDKLEDYLLQFIWKKTRLAPFEEEEPLDTYGIKKFLTNRKIDWPEFGDAEVYGLRALANVWSLRPPDRVSAEGIEYLCNFILDTYGVDDFNTNWILFRVSSRLQAETGVIKSIEAIKYVVDYLLAYDRKSRLYLAANFSYLDAEISTKCPGWPYSDPDPQFCEEIITTYEKAQNHLDIFPAFHRKLARVYEIKAKVGSQPAGAGLVECINSSVAEYRKVCRLNPNNQQDRLNLLDVLGRQLIAPDRLEDPFKKRDAPRLIEVEFSSQSMNDLGVTETGLPRGLEDRITELRKALKKEEAGFLLPGINFRDNRAFARGVYRLLIRGVPSPLATLDPASTQEEQWEKLTRSLGQQAIQKADRFYTPQDCYWRLNEITKEDRLDYKDIQDDPQLLSALTWVLKALLSEQTPIVATSAIVAEFRRCQAFKLDLTTTVENIRSIPAVRKRLKGNSILVDPPPIVSTLNGALEGELEAAIDWRIPVPANRPGGIHNVGELEAAIDWSIPEPMLASEPGGVRKQIRLLAFSALKQAGRGPAVIVTGPRVRPFVRKMLADVEVSVLSNSEVFPELLQDKEIDAAYPKELHAAAGN